MKKFIITYNRADTISTNDLDLFWDAKIVVHSREQAKLYATNENILRSQIIISGVDPGKAGKTRQQKWVMDNLVEKGEWVMFIDDDITKVYGIDKKYYDILMMPIRDVSTKFLLQAYNKPCSSNYFEFIIKDSIKRAEKIGAKLCAFGPFNDPFFKDRKWNFMKPVMGALLVIKNNKAIKWDYYGAMDDTEMTAEHLLKFGAVVINNFLWTDHGFYNNDGGHGLISGKRNEERVENIKVMMEKYPGLFKKIMPKTKIPNVKLAFTSPEKLYQWRIKMHSTTKREEFT